VSSFKEPPKLLPPNPAKTSLPAVDGVTSVVERPLTLFNRSHEDQRCFDFFRAKSVHKICTGFDAAFWHHNLLQLSQTEPTTWHSLLAFASAVELKMLGETDDQLVAATRRFSLTHYTQAIVLLTTRITHSKPCIEVLLTNCYLFFSLEMLLGNVESAIAQVQGGLQLIRSWRKTDHDHDQADAKIDNLFGPMFNHLLTCAIVFGRDIPLTTKFPTDPSIPKPDSFETPQTAILSFIQLAGAFMQSAQEFEIYKFNNELTDYDIYLAFQHKRRISARLEDWVTRVNTVIRKSKLLDQGPAELQAISAIKSGYKIWFTCIVHRFDQEETVYDAYIQDFKEALEVGQTFCEEGSSTHFNRRANPNDPFLMAHFIRIYMVVTKCRNPHVRRRALQYLKTFPYDARWNLGFWNARMMASVAERAIEIEEEGLEDLRDETGEIVPSEWARIHEICVLSDTSSDSKRRLVQFRCRVEGNWVLRREWFVV
jgi:hypothetical protein